MPAAESPASEDALVCYAMAKFLDNSGFLNIQPRAGFPLEIVNFWQYVNKYPISASG